jgi:hypothetical protein
MHRRSGRLVHLACSPSSPDGNALAATRRRSRLSSMSHADQIRASVREKHSARPPSRFRGNVKAHARGNNAFDLASVLDGVPARDNVLRMDAWQLLTADAPLLPVPETHTVRTTCWSQDVPKRPRLRGASAGLSGPDAPPERRRRHRGSATSFSPRGQSAQVGGTSQGRGRTAWETSLSVIVLIAVGDVRPIVLVLRLTTG